MVDRKILRFLQIKACYLMVGHTHEDIDQMFSCISRRLLKNNARTLLELIREIGISYSPAILSTLLSFINDVKEWMDGWMNVPCQISLVMYINTSSSLFMARAEKRFCLTKAEEGTRGGH